MGHPSFLPSFVNSGRTFLYLCQCPNWSDLHFYLYYDEIIWRYILCVNALTGATFISTGATMRKNGVILNMCQCPNWGDLHFYSNFTKTQKRMRKCVNALTGATFISTNRRKRRRINQGKCVNALTGATFISTFRNILRLSACGDVSMP